MNKEEKYISPKPGTLLDNKYTPFLVLVLKTYPGSDLECFFLNANLVVRTRLSEGYWSVIAEVENNKLEI